MVDEVSKYNNRKKEWKKFYNIKDELSPPPNKKT